VKNIAERWASALKPPKEFLITLLIQWSLLCWWC